MYQLTAQLSISVAADFFFFLTLLDAVHTDFADLLIFLFIEYLG
jgi:hypothetical protein